MSFESVKEWAEKHGIPCVMRDLKEFSARRRINHF
jgi:hypothetical protein